jgi:hypothetical protein
MRSVFILSYSDHKLYTVNLGYNGSQGESKTIRYNRNPLYPRFR